MHTIYIEFQGLREIFVMITNLIYIDEPVIKFASSYTLIAKTAYGAQSFCRELNLCLRTIASSGHSTHTQFLKSILKQSTLRFNCLKSDW